MEEVIKELSKLDTSKSTQKSDIPANLVKVNYDKFSEFLYENFNNILETGNFPKQLKCADVKLKNEKRCKIYNENYRSVSIFPSISKIYERCLLGNSLIRLFLGFNMRLEKDLL